MTGPEGNAMTEEQKLIVEGKFDRYYGGVDTIFLACVLNYIAVLFLLIFAETGGKNGYTMLIMFVATLILLIGACRLMPANIILVMMYLAVSAVKNSETQEEIPSFLTNRLVYAIPSILIMFEIVLEIFVISVTYRLYTMTIPSLICLILITAVSAGRFFVESRAIAGMTPALQVWENILNLTGLTVLFLCVRKAKKEFDSVRRDASYLEICRNYTVTYPDEKRMSEGVRREADS